MAWTRLELGEDALVDGAVGEDQWGKTVLFEGYTACRGCEEGGGVGGAWHCC